MTSPFTIPIPEDLQAFVEARVEAGNFGTPREYIRELILDDRDRRLLRIEESLLKAMEGPFVAITADEWRSGDIMAIAEERLAQLKSR